MNNILLTEYRGQNIIFNNVFKYQNKNWNLKHQIILQPDNIDKIPLKKLAKLKIYKEQPIEGYFLIKIISIEQNNYPIQFLYAVSFENHRNFFQGILINKLKHLGLQFDQFQNYGYQIEAQCLKKSQIKKNWEERIIKINNSIGLTSKKIEKQKQTLHVKNSKQIWTRFQLINNKQYFVMKCKHMLKKYQIALPSKNAAKWIKAFYSLFLQ